MRRTSVTCVSRNGVCGNYVSSVSRTPPRHLLHSFCGRGKSVSCVLLECDSLNFIKGDLIVPPIIEPGGTSRFVSGHLLRDLQLAAVL
jgi:hypothetical protein